MPNRYRTTPYIPAKDPLGGIPPSRHPFQFWALLACIVSGAGNLVHSHSSINDLLPPASVKAWAAIMILGGGMAIAGAFKKDRVTGLLWERLALTAICLATLVYGGAILFVVGLGALTPGSLAIAIGIAAGWRCVHVNRELQIVRSMLRWIAK